MRSCKRPADDPHHVCSRTMMGGPVEWVAIDGAMVANVAGLCRWHHDKVEQHHARIYWDGAEWRYSSETQDSPLRPLLQVEAVAAIPNSCPCCGRRMPKPGAYRPGPRRKRKTYTVPVPDDGEDGEQVLDALAGNVAELMGMHDTPSARYFAIAAALAAVTQDPATLAELTRKE